MTDIPYRTALIVGAGPGISASVARALASAGLKVGLAARTVEKLVPLQLRMRRNYNGLPSKNTYQKLFLFW
jgi:NADP-dependent 3-hydroxy acid dehydrogenase YdfG